MLSILRLTQAEQVGKNTEIVEEFGRRFSILVREKYGKIPPQQELGRDLGVAQPTARSWLNGENVPGMEKAIEVAMFFGVCVEWLLTGRGAKFPTLPDPTDELSEAAWKVVRGHHLGDDQEKRMMEMYAEDIIRNKMKTTEQQ